MTTDYRTKILVPALLTLSFATAIHAAPPPVDAFGRKPAVIDVDVNPAGTRLAWLEENGNISRLIIIDLTTGKDLRTVTAPDGVKLWRLAWANDESVLISKSETQKDPGMPKQKFEMQRWSAIDVAGGSDRVMLMQDGNRDLVSGASLLRARTATPGKIYMSTLDFSATNYKQETGSRLSGGRKDSGWIHNAYEVDVKNGKSKLIASGSSFTREYLVDHSGTKIVRSDFNPQQREQSILVKAGISWRSLYRSKECGELDLRGFSADGAAVLALGSTCDDGKNKFWSIPLDGTAMKSVFDDPALEIEGTVRDSVDGKVLAVSLGGQQQTVRWLDPDAERRSKALHKSFGARWITFVSRSADNQKVVVLVEDETHPPIHYLVDYAAKKADILNEAYPLLSGVKLGTVRDFNYEARDKYSLTGYLTLPSGAVEKGLPLVVMPHGGPEARDETGFDWLAQFLASRGYAVLQPQFRGSTGRGRAHADAGRQQWGLRMQDDVTDGVKALITQGIVDPKRVCIVGWSYGGYAALAGAAFTPDLYACAASIGGVSDLPVMLGAINRDDGRDSDSFAYWREHIGSPFDPDVIAKSPARAAATVRAPILLLHGTNDTVVPIDQSRLMASALRKASKPVELIELTGEDHWMKTSSNSRIRTLTELERFLWQYIGSVQPAAAAASATN
ncbi:MAG TPA: alpha/beta fold hydrolase [Steroidobacteraceae bacterium]|nr:alpha/beta fold hydrolase [Steroidobacteraceae bacterium]